MLPEPANQTLVARLRFHPDSGPCTRERGGWLDAVKERVSNRRNERAQTLTNAEIDDLAAAAADAGGAFEAITDATALATLGLSLGENVNAYFTPSSPFPT